MANVSTEDFVQANRVCVSFDEIGKLLGITAGYAKSKFKTLHNQFSVKSQSYPWRKKLRYYKDWDVDNRGRKRMSDEDIDNMFEDYTEPTILNVEMKEDLTEAKANAFIAN